MGKVIAFIPARGGSVSIPFKNIKMFCGKPLIYWNLYHLQACEKIDEVWLATDSDKIREVLKGFSFSKVKVYDRDYENAQSSSSTESVMIEFIKKGYCQMDDTLILVQATSPLTTSMDFEHGINLFQEGQYDSVLSGVKFKRFFWHLNGEPYNYDFRNRPRRQDFDGVFLENGAYYINRVSNILKDNNRLSGKIGVAEMPEYTAIELDEQVDWEIAEAYMKRYIFPNRSGLNPKIKLFATDVDGVLTDAGMYYSENGDELKRFNTRDGKGFELLRMAGIKTAIVTSEDTKIVARRAEKLKVDYLYQGKHHFGKLDAIKEICKKENIQLKEVAYIGDDLNCKEVLENVGLAACPEDAIDEILGIANILVVSRRGGHGAVRKLAEIILDNGF